MNGDNTGKIRRLNKMSLKCYSLILITILFLLLAVIWEYNLRPDVSAFYTESKNTITIKTKGISPDKLDSISIEMIPDVKTIIKVR